MTVYHFCDILFLIIKKEVEHNQEKDKWKRGLPYVGNKGQKAENIIDLFPAGNRFIDCFGGGGSISLHAWDSGKWKNDVVYCDPPYFGTGEDYGGFDFDAFHEWYMNCPADVYIGEYTQLPNTEVYADLGTKHSLTATNKRRNELLLKVIK